MITKRAVNTKTSSKTRRHVIVGDVHGELTGLKDILSQAGLIDLTGNWCGNDAVLVQTGDVIDRGPHSVEAVRYLRTLQSQATETSGRVVRLCGNHELMLLQNDWRFVNFADPAGLASELREEILAGNVLASYTDGVRLYTHAGLRSQIRMAVEAGTRTDSGERGLKGLSDLLNRIFVKCLEAGDLETHSIFHIDPERGGDHEIGGIFWGDYSRIIGSAKAYDIPQVFGHTPTGKNGIEHSHGLKLIDIDAGMYKGYGGHRVYLEIERTGAVCELSMAGVKWTRKKLVHDARSRRCAS